MKKVYSTVFHRGKQWKRSTAGQQNDFFILQPDFNVEISPKNVQFIYSEKITKFCEISTLLLTGTTKDKSKMEILQNFAAKTEHFSVFSWTISKIFSRLIQIFLCFPVSTLFSSILKTPTRPPPLPVL